MYLDVDIYVHLQHLYLKLLTCQDILELTDFQTDYFSVISDIKGGQTHSLQCHSWLWSSHLINGLLLWIIDAAVQISIIFWTSAVEKTWLFNIALGNAAVEIRQS